MYILVSDFDGYWDDVRNNYASYPKKMIHLGLCEPQSNTKSVFIKIDGANQILQGWKGVVENIRPNNNKTGFSFTLTGALEDSELCRYEGWCSGWYIDSSKKSINQSSKVNFFAKYKDPRWQRKRLEVMEVSKFKCENCGANDKTLNVHHKSYKKNHAPWEYEIKELECLCEDCHSYKHDIKNRLTAALHEFKTNPNNNERPEEELLGFLEGRLADGPFGVIPTSDEYLRGYCTSYLLDVDEINADGKLSEIIEAGNGYLEFEMFDWAFGSQAITSSRASYVRKAIAKGVYTHYPAWLLEKIEKLIGLDSI